jgi:hypothetical protein
MSYLYFKKALVSNSDDIIANFRALIFLWRKNKGLIVIATFLFQRSADFFCPMQQVMSFFQIRARPLIFPRKSTL